MVVGGVVSLVGPHVGVARPLDVAPQSVIWTLLSILVLAIGSVTRRDPVSWVFEGVGSRQVFVVLGCGLLAVLSILGVAQLNFSGNDHLAVFATTLDVVVLLAGIVGGWKPSSKWPLNALLYSASLALLLSTSLRGGHLYGWDVQQEFGVASNTANAGVWVIPANHDPYASMLSLTVLPAILHSLVKLRILAFFQLVIPAILALLPLAVFSTVRSVPRWITSGRATPRPGLAFAVVVGLIVSSVAFSSELVSITRQAMALTLLTALVMVLFDRAMVKRSAQIVVCVLIVAISFTHYTTSYLLAGIFLCAWPVGVMWSKGWLGVPKEKRERHQYDVRSRRIINMGLVVVALVAAFGWNIAVTRNYALSAPSSAITTKGAGISASTNPTFITPRRFEQLLVSELEKTASYIVRVPGSDAVHLIAATVPTSPGVAPSFSAVWGDAIFLTQESLWVFLGIALLYGVYSLGRRRSYEYTSDLVGLAVTGLLIGAFLRFSGTLASFYSPERAAIFTAILLAAPLTLFLDDIVAIVSGVSTQVKRRLVRALAVAGFVFVAILVVGATGLGALFFGGQAPGSLSAGDVNVEQFTVSTPEVATAAWLRENVKYPNIVQTDLYGHLVLLSDLGSYDLIDEVVPPEVDHEAYVYLSTVNLQDGLSQAAADNGNYYSFYRSNIKFFEKNFYVVYSTGATRVYH
jgi:uncharacterized membrane protein